MALFHSQLWRRIQEHFRPAATRASKVLFRHGDLLVGKADAIPEGSRRLQHLVLAEGELTGHSHRVAERDAAVLYQSRLGLFLSVTGQRATLVHQEHGPICLERGVYHIWRQREYSPREIRVVRD